MGNERTSLIRSFRLVREPKEVDSLVSALALHDIHRYARKHVPQDDLCEELSMSPSVLVLWTSCPHSARSWHSNLVAFGCLLDRGGGGGARRSSTLSWKVIIADIEEVDKDMATSTTTIAPPEAENLGKVAASLARPKRPTRTAEYLHLGPPHPLN